MRHGRALALVVAVGCGAGATPASPPPAPGPSADAGIDEGGHDASVDGGAPADAGGAEAAPTPRAVAVTTWAPRIPRSPAGKTSAQHAARLVAGTWVRLEPAAEGTYSFETTARTWTIAFGCASEDGRSSGVAVHTASAAALDVVLEDACAPAPSLVATLTGKLKNVPTGTAWLDVAYAREARGSAITLQGTQADYEVVNLDRGTWDLAFGVRPQAASPLTRVAIARDLVIADDRTFDVDLADGGAPAARAIAVATVDNAETLEASLVHTSAAGAGGLDVAPRTWTAGAVARGTWDALPRALLRTADAYRVEAQARGPGGATTRAVEATFHADADLDLTLPARAAPGTLDVDRAGARARIAAQVPDVAGAAAHELLTIVERSARDRRVVRVVAEPDPARARLETSSDVFDAPGFDPAWALSPTATIVGTVTARGGPTPFGDGTQRWSSSWTSTSRP